MDDIKYHNIPENLPVLSTTPVMGTATSKNISTYNASQNISTHLVTSLEQKLVNTLMLRPQLSTGRPVPLRVTFVEGNLNVTWIHRHPCSMLSLFRAISWYSISSKNCTINNNQTPLYDVPPTCFGLNMVILQEVSNKGILSDLPWYKHLLTTQG